MCISWTLKMTCSLPLYLAVREVKFKQKDKGEERGAEAVVYTHFAAEGMMMSQMRIAAFMLQ